MLLALVVALGVLAAPAGADVKVSLHDGKMDIVAKRAPVAEILDRVASQTGMKVIYDGPRPQKVITKSVTNRTPADAVLGILEGEGLNFAVILNASSTQIETLLVTGPSKAKPQLRPQPAAAPPMAPGQEEGWSVEVDEPPPPPPPPPPAEAAVEPDPAMPDGQNVQGGNPTPPPMLLPAPPPPPASPFTPQGPGPVILNIPGATATPPPR